MRFGSGGRRRENEHYRRWLKDYRVDGACPNGEEPALKAPIWARDGGFQWRHSAVAAVNLGSLAVDGYSNLLGVYGSLERHSIISNRAIKMLNIGHC